MNLKIKKDKYLVVLEWEVEKGKEDIVETLWQETKLSTLLDEYSLYKGISKDTFVLLYQVEEFSKIQEILESAYYEDFIDDIAPYTTSDLHQGIYGFVDAVKERKGFIPTTKYMQLRIIEVPLNGIDSYLEWRKRRIYKYVEKNDKVASFLSFHSVFATNPGVLFVAEFEGDPVEYKNSFLTDEYKVIIKEAGHDHIKGGLNTFEYELVDKK